MSPAARKATDEEIFGATIAAVSRVGPERMTLGDIAREVGLTAGALVQRFGSKRDLLLAAIRAGNASPGDYFAGYRAPHASPLAAVLDYAACAARWLETPEEMANQLAMLQLDVTDPDFRAEAARYFQAERDALRSWFAEAVEAGELVGDADPERLARAFQALSNGSRLIWGILREGPPETSALHEMETLLAPYRRESRRDTVSS